MQGAQMVLIKKYSNRRLYDTEESRYITLEELADKIRTGQPVRVVDAASGEDLTQSTLAQIILESRGAARLLPVPLLLNLIRMGDEALAEFMGVYLSYALELYAQAKQSVQTVAPYNPFASLPFQATSALARWLTPVAASPWGEPARAPAAAPAPPPPAPAAPPSDDVAALRRELEELKQAVRPRPKARKRPSRA